MPISDVSLYLSNLANVIPGYVLARAIERHPCQLVANPALLPTMVSSPKHMTMSLRSTGK